MVQVDGRAALVRPAERTQPSKTTGGPTGPSATPARSATAASIPRKISRCGRYSAYQYRSPPSPIGSNTAVCRMLAPSEQGVTSNCSQARPGSRISASSDSTRGGSHATTRQQSSTSPARRSSGVAAPALHPNAAEHAVQHAAQPPERVGVVPAARAAPRSGRPSRAATRLPAGGCACGLTRPRPPAAPARRDGPGRRGKRCGARRPRGRRPRTTAPRAPPPARSDRATRARARGSRRRRPSPSRAAGSPDPARRRPPPRCPSRIAPR